MSEFGGTPLAVGTVKGQRQWTVDHLGRLRGVTHTAVWLPGENVAECRATEQQYYLGERPKKHDRAEVPRDECSCGFWAYHQGSAVKPSGTKHVTGIIEGYGPTIIGTKGFRCAKARVVALLLETDRPRLRHNYPCVDFFTTYDDMLAAHPLEWFGPTPETHEDFWTREAAPPSDDYAAVLSRLMVNSAPTTSGHVFFNSGGVLTIGDYGYSSTKDKPPTPAPPATKGNRVSMVVMDEAQDWKSAWTLP